MKQIQYFGVILAISNALAFVPNVPSSFLHQRRCVPAKPACCRSTFTSSISTGAPTIPVPLSPETLAGKVEQRLMERFGADQASRIIQSWRLLDAGYEHRQRFSEDPNSNFIQLAPSYVPGLTVRQFWDCSSIEWCDKLASHYEEIREEFVRVTSDMETLKSQGNNVWAGALTQDASSCGEGWRTLVLFNRGAWDKQNVAMFPKTAKAVRDCDMPIVEAFFASMTPQSKIQMHSDFTNFVLTCHLPLVIPKNGENKCRLTIGDETRQWLNGEVMVFDTSLMHDAVNETDETRYILMLRVWHPDLTPVERDALQFLFDCLEVPELVSSDAAERFFAEQRLELNRSFPDTSTEVKATKSSLNQKSAESFDIKQKNKRKAKERSPGAGSKGFGKR